MTKKKIKFAGFSKDLKREMAKFGIDSAIKSLMKFFVAYPIVALVSAIIFSITAVWMMGVAIEQFLSGYAWLSSLFVVILMFKTKQINNRVILISSLVIATMFYSLGFVSYATALPSIPIIGTLIKGLYGIVSIAILPIAVIPLFVVQLVQIYSLSFVATVFQKSNIKSKKRRKR